jgi:hypothetical protein
MKSTLNNFIPSKIAFFLICTSLFSYSYFFLIYSYSFGAGDFLYSLDSNPFGKNKKWLAEWWKFNLGISAEDHPNYINPTASVDNTKEPSKCYIGEDKVNNVLFPGVPPVEDKFPVRTCDTPAGKAIFLPIESSQCDYGQEGIANEKDLIDCAKSGNNGVVAKVSLDGVDAEYNVGKNRIMTDLFNITMNNKMMGNYSGSYGSLSEGYTVFLKPLSVGNHTLKYDVSVIDPIDPSYNYVQQATFHFVVR